MGFLCMHKNNDVRKLKKESARILLDKADALDKEKKYDEAIKAYKHIISIYPRCWEAYYGLSCTYTCKEIENDTKNKYAKEQLDLYKTLEKNDPNFDSYQVLAGNLADVGRYIEALHYYDKAIEHELSELKKDPSYLDWLEDIYENKAKILTKLQLYKEALEHYNKAVAKSKQTKGNDTYCILFYAAQREIYCILKDYNMIEEIDRRIEKAENLKQKYKQTKNSKKNSRFASINESLKNIAKLEDKTRKDMCELVLIKLENIPRDVFNRKPTELINDAIEEMLRDMGQEEDTKYIVKADVARLVNAALQERK